MIKVLFYYGPGDLITRTIRVLTHGPYSHVEIQFTDGCRFFSSGHGLYIGAHMICDRKIYDPCWDQILIPATQEQERAAEGFIFHLIGLPFDMRGMVGFLFPFLDRGRQGTYCSSIILNVLQESLHMFPGIGRKISPNGLYRLFLAAHPLVIAAAAPDTPANPAWEQDPYMPALRISPPPMLGTISGGDEPGAWRETGIRTE